MNLAKELADQQIFFRRGLNERVGWFIGLSWMAAALALGGAVAGHYLHLKTTSNSRKTSAKKASPP